MKKKSKKRKIHKKRVFLFFVTVGLIVLFGYKISNARITNIIIIGNTYYSDQEIIDKAGLSEQPSSLNNLTFDIEKKLKKDVYILDVNVKKNIFLNKVTISIKENYPLFFYSSDNKTVLYNGKTTEEKYNDLTVINKIPDEIYKKFLTSMQKLSIDSLTRISEIQYKPNEVDNERFFILMSDGNYVYINLKRFQNLNKYIDIIKSFDEKKGILYLDSGEYFDVFDE